MCAFLGVYVSIDETKYVWFCILLGSIEGHREGPRAIERSTVAVAQSGVTKRVRVQWLLEAELLPV